MVHIVMVSVRFNQSSPKMWTIFPGSGILDHGFQLLNPHSEPLGYGESQLPDFFLGGRITLGLDSLDDDVLGGCTQLANRLFMLSD